MTDLGGGIEVSGGRGGTVARLADLHQAAQSLETAAARLDDAAAALAAASQATWEGDEALGSGRAARTALAPLLNGLGSPGETAESLRALTRSLRAAAEGYEQAEGAVERLVRGLVGAHASWVGEGPLGWPMAWVAGAHLATSAGLVALWVKARTGRWPEPTTMARTGGVELLLHGVTSHLQALRPGIRLAPPHPVGSAAEPLAAILGHRQVSVRVLGSTRTLHGAERPRDDAGLLRLIDDAYPGGAHGGLGVVSVLRFDQPDGSRSWAVAIPGTQDSGPEGDNPMRATTNVPLMAGLPDGASDLVLQALDQAGAEPGEPVLLAGHSQGGMAAMAVASAVAVTGRHTVTHVLTAGSPVAGMAAPPGVATKHLEHSTDVVPTLDGLPSPDTPQRLTVSVDLRTSTDPADRVASYDVIESHALTAYARSSERVEAAGAQDPSLRWWRDSVQQGIYGPDGTTVTVTQYQGSQPVTPDVVGRPGTVAGLPQPPRLGPLVYPAAPR
ncbi:hypothetical protein QUV83_16935 [Cellulomonas cellasea]|uniref:hypothetical protein n=1 Tax=Cellulomonas cellasea TaxID=43670 RepID=UPI0025A3CB3C|nr:hypothetical protein [Cellulomonas cellasea]MDM8086460.1 hypothetical protein [Cellulomonas cellasea]